MEPHELASAYEGTAPRDPALVQTLSTVKGRLRHAAAMARKRSSAYRQVETLVKEGMTHEANEHLIRAARDAHMDALILAHLYISGPLKTEELRDRVDADLREGFVGD